MAYTDHWIFSESENKILENIGEYLKMVEAAKVTGCNVFERIEPRARKADFANALSFEVFDPLWMLTRQWQYGRFKGNDCGSPVTTKIKTSKRRLDTISLNPDKNKYGAYSTDTPMEYEVEKQNRTITPFIRIESALHFKKMVENTHPECDALITKLIALCPLEPFIPLVAEKDKTIETLKLEQNANLKRLYATYGKRMFDGYTLYLMPIDKIENILNEAELSHIPLNELLQNYQAWFTRKYLPVTHHEGGCWNESKLGYEVAMGENLNSYDAENYHTGQLSWYSFDAAEGAAASIAKLKGKSSVELPEEKEEKMFSYLPAPAEFPGAPSKTLWEFEDARVQLGQMDNNDFSLLANAVVMQYTTMYGNDWMVTPIETETGTILEVDGIIITDTFGERIFINTSAEEADANDNSKAFTDRWSMFGTTQANAYEKNNFSSRKGLLFPPTLSRCEESHPIEEVQFLRDEMANMLWGVETTINNGCDGTLSGKSLSDAVLTEVDAQKGEHVVNENEYDYSFLVQNRAPLNWIPFIPQKIPTEIRDIRFRRGKMPIFFNGIYDSVRPSTQLLGIKKDDRNEKIVPLFINEEEITGYGVKLVLTAQRTRWFHGESFNWIGYKKVINMYQANSGLMFDELIERETQKSIVLHPEEETEL